MKQSTYNRVVPIPESGQVLLFNGVTTAMLKLNGRSYARARGILSACDAGDFVPVGSDEDVLLEKLVDGRFIIPDDFDELEFLKTRYHLSRFNDAFSLTILPTLACNLECVYCYEERRPGVMTKEIERAVCAFAEEKVTNDRPARFSVSWYGGEPLLASSTIRRLSEKFIEIAELNGIPYKATMTTNGTLLTNLMADELVKHNVVAMQITLDGPKEIHDARRPMANGKGSSFDTIVENLENVAGRMTVSIRINTDKQNAARATELLELFDKKGWIGKSPGFYPYMTPVSELTEVCSPAAGNCCTIGSLFEVSQDFCMECAERGVPVKTHSLYHFPICRKFNCGAVGVNSIGVVPSGALHKCSLTVSDDTQAVGHITRPLDLANPKLLKWLSFDPFSYKECRECNLLPNCLASCPKRALDGQDPARSDSCRYLREHIDARLLMHGE
ncbi:radical SAM protein [Candidatus Hydrogenedentota bacterium]